jgi:type 2 lantibiotic biosynthesis protein LanM
LHYRLDIIQGFKEAICFLEQEKKTLLDENGPLTCFKGKKVRCLLKGTQRYASILGFSNHPNYTQEMFYREKLFENIWAYPHSDKRIVMSEIRDLLVGDIPIFYSCVDSTNLEDSCGQVIKNFYSHPGIQRAKNRIASLNKDEIERQIDYLLVTLDCFEDVSLINRKVVFPLLKKEVKVNGIALAKEIADDLMKKAVWNEAHNEVSFATLDFLAKSEQLGIRPTNEGLYDSLSGLAFFFYELFVQTKEEKYIDFYKILIQSAINISKNQQKFVSAYQGRLAPFFPILSESKNTGKSESISYIDDTVQEIIAEKFFEVDSNDWINGKVSILTLLVETYKMTHSEKLRKILNEQGNLFIEKWRKQDVNDLKIEFAHGISGIVRGLASLYELMPSQTLSILIENLLIYEFDHLSSQEDYRLCWGLPGLILARLTVIKMLPNEKIQQQTEKLVHQLMERISQFFVNDDCLCHGNAGMIELFNYLISDWSQDLKKIKEYRNQYLSTMIMNRWLNGNFHILRLRKIETVGLFTGVAGVGLACLHFNNEKDSSNILTLTV